MSTSPPTTWLSVDGKKFYNVGGSKPYYLEIPEINAVFFVTSDDRQTKYIYHFVMLKGRRDITIRTPHTYLNLGIGTLTNSSTHAWVDSVKWPMININLAISADSVVTKYKFNLDKGTVISSGPGRDSP